MSNLLQFLKKTNPHLNITLDPSTNTVKVHNSEEDIKKHKIIEKSVPKPKKIMKFSSEKKQKLAKILNEMGCNDQYINMVCQWNDQKLSKTFSHLLK